MGGGVIESRLPELGENVATVEVSAVLVAAGDAVRADQPVIEVETEKASLEVPAGVAGRVREVRVRGGDTIRVGDVILLVEPEAEEGERSRGPEQALPPAATPPDGKDAAPRPPAPPPEPAAGGTAAVVEFPGQSKDPAPDLGQPVPAAPSVRALARELGVDLREVTGTGAGGRISRDDVKAHAKKKIRAAAAGAGGALPAELPDFTRWGEIERRPLAGVRRVTAEQMARSWAAIPLVTQFDGADVTQLEAMRKRFNQRPEAAESKLSLTAMALKVTGAALRRFPQFNASLDAAAGEIVYKRYVHIGVAVGTDRGLLVPVIRDADKKGLLELAAELDGAAARARAKKTAPDELRGATFTISNLGGLGTTSFTPLVNWPEVAILGLGRAEIRAVHEEGAFVPRLILPLAVSYDHRLIDGADAARFLRWIAEALEQPLVLLLEAHS